MSTEQQLSSGDWLEVKSKEEILGTLDSEGRLDGLPFMPEMLAYCGQRFQVSKRAHKTCDPVHGMQGRRMPNAVHLEDQRCDGSAHDGCQARCLLYWKTDWLVKIDEAQTTNKSAASLSPNNIQEPSDGARGCRTDDLLRATRDPTKGQSGETTYVCQATQVRAATTPIPTWDIRQYVEDVQSGNVGLGRVVGSAFAAACHLLASSGLGFGSLVRGLYNLIQKLYGGAPYPWGYGKIPKGQRTPASELNLQAGELVRVKSHQDVLHTLNDQNFTRGLLFGEEIVPYCGKAYRVLDRVQRIIDEATGRMLTFKNPTILLDGVVCQARYSKHRRFCPRGYYHYFREAWLERLPVELEDSPRQ